jgi:hypothetical protein
LFCLLEKAIGYLDLRFHHDGKMPTRLLMVKLPADWSPRQGPAGATTSIHRSERTANNNGYHPVERCLPSVNRTTERIP